MRLLKARLSEWTRAPWMLVLLFAADLVELSASVGLALATEPPKIARLPYAALDVPVAPTRLTLGVAMMGVIVGLLMGAAIIAEMVVIVRRAQIFSWRYGTARDRRRAAAAAVTAPRR